MGDTGCNNVARIRTRDCDSAVVLLIGSGDGSEDSSVSGDTGSAGLVAGGRGELGGDTPYISEYVLEVGRGISRCLKSLLETVTLSLTVLRSEEGLVELVDLDLYREATSP